MGRHMLNILVVEDNTIARKNLVKMLKNLNGDICIFEANCGKQAIEILKKEAIGLFFLDIQLPDFSGLKIAEIIRSIDRYELTYIVFITTNVIYQLEAFKKYHCYDFIEKPYKKEDVLEVSKRLIKGIKATDTKEETISFELKNCILNIRVQDILYIEAQRKNCIVHTKMNLYTIPNMIMKRILEKMRGFDFIQTHKSYIINLKNIDQIQKHEKNSWQVYFKDYTSSAYISNTYKEIFIKRFLGESTKRGEV